MNGKGLGEAFKADLLLANIGAFGALIIVLNLHAVMRQGCNVDCGMRNKLDHRW